MSETESDAADVAAVDVASDPESHLKRKSNDIGWQWGRLFDPNNYSKVKCLLCGHESSGGINRFKQHLACEGTGVLHCPKATPEIKQKCKEDLDRPRKKKRDKAQAEADLRGGVVIAGREGSEAESKAGSSSTSDGSAASSQKLGPMDRWARPIDPKATREEAKRQQNINEALWKERTHQVQQYVARWIYNHGIAFNAIDNDEFIEMVEAIGCFGPGFRPPSQHDLREKLLVEEHARMKSLLQEREEGKKQKWLFSHD